MTQPQPNKQATDAFLDSPIMQKEGLLIRANDELNKIDYNPNINHSVIEPISSITITILDIPDMEYAKALAAVLIGANYASHVVHTHEKIKIGQALAKHNFSYSDSNHTMTIRLDMNLLPKANHPSLAPRERGRVIREELQKGINDIINTLSLWNGNQIAETAQMEYASLSKFSGIVRPGTPSMIASADLDSQVILEMQEYYKKAKRKWRDEQKINEKLHAFPPKPTEPQPPNENGSTHVNPPLPKEKPYSPLPEIVSERLAKLDENTRAIPKVDLFAHTVEELAKNIDPEDAKQKEFAAIVLGVPVVYKFAQVLGVDGTFAGDAKSTFESPTPNRKNELAFERNASALKELLKDESIAKWIAEELSLKIPGISVLLSAAMDKKIDVERKRDAYFGSAEGLLAADLASISDASSPHIKLATDLLAAVAKPSPGK